MSFSLSAQTVLDECVAKMTDSCVEADYNYSMDDGRFPVKGSGHITMQGNGYAMTGNGLEIYCNGTTKWTVDREALEVIIENADSLDLGTNPFLLLRQYKTLFRCVSTEYLDFESKSCIGFTMAPISKSEISGVELYFTSDGKSFAGLRADMKKGTVITVTIPSFKLLPVSASKSFSFDISSLSEDFIITDLR